jgi:hypothetical protein
VSDENAEGECRLDIEAVELSSTSLTSITESQNMDAANKDVEMLEDNDPTTESTAVDAPVEKKKKKYAGPIEMPRMYMAKKSDNFCGAYFLRALKQATSDQFMTARSYMIRPPVWPIEHIRDLNTSLSFIGQLGHDAARLRAFFTNVFEMAVQVRSENPRWFPQIPGQVMLLNNLNEFIYEVHDRLRGVPINAGGMVTPMLFPPTLIYDTINNVVADRQDFLTDPGAMIALEEGRLRPLSKKQKDMFKAIEDWKAGLPGGKYLLSELRETAIDPSVPFTIPLRPRDIEEQGDDEEDEEEEHWEDEEDEGVPEATQTTLVLRPRKPISE